MDDGSYEAERRQDPEGSAVKVLGEVVVFEDLDGMQVESAVQDRGDRSERFGDLVGVCTGFGIALKESLVTAFSDTSSVLGSRRSFDRRGRFASGRFNRRTAGCTGNNACFQESKGGGYVGVLGVCAAFLSPRFADGMIGG